MDVDYLWRNLWKRLVSPSLRLLLSEALHSLFNLFPVILFFSSIFETLPLDIFFIFFLPVCWITNLLLHPTLIILLSDDLCSPCCFWRETLLCFIIHGCVTLEVVIADFYPSQAPSWCSNHLQSLDTMGCLHHAHIDQQRAERAHKSISVADSLKQVVVIV